MHSIWSLLILCAAVYAKDLHIKGTKTETIKDDDNNFLDFYHSDDNVYADNERYVRHVELVTESVLEHLLAEIKNKYSDKRNNSDSSIPTLVRRLKMKMKQMNKKKLKKHKRKSLRRFNSTGPQLTTVQQ